MTPRKIEPEKKSDPYLCDNGKSTASYMLKIVFSIFSLSYQDKMTKKVKEKLN